MSAIEPLAFVMAILGCGESDAPCRELAVVARRFESEAACLAGAEAELSRRDDIAFPSVVAQCRPAGSAPQMLRGSDVILPEPRVGAPVERFAVNGHRPVSEDEER